MATDTSGILLLNKLAGITSFKALGKIKKDLKDYNGKKVKVGHTGTLDSFAEGLLVVLTGKFTRLNPAFTAFDKTYEAEIIFGTQTDTLDPDGKVIDTGIVPDLEIIKSKIGDFTGIIKQQPPAFSAVHIDGERAWKKALKGEISEMPEREVKVYSFEIIEWNSPILRCRIHCSKGTYIRSIARDLGKACCSCARLESLKRLTVGPFNVRNSVLPDNFSAEKHLLTGREAFQLLAQVCPTDFNIIDVNPALIHRIKQGAALDHSFFINPPSEYGKYVLFDEKDFIAYINYNNANYSYIFVG